MPADRLLNTVLQYYQDVHDAAKTEQIIGTTVHLLTQLSNPLNLGLLTSQLLTAPAIWHRRNGPKTAVRVISIFNTAAARVRDQEAEAAKRKSAPARLRCDQWTRAVVKGADDRSSRWQHLLVLTGVLMGMQGGDGDGRHALSPALRDTLEQAVVTASNLALRGNVDDGPAAAASVITALNFAFPYLSEHHRAQIDCDALLPIVVWGMTGEEGFCDGQFLRAVQRDTTLQLGRAYSWPATSSSYILLRDMEKEPLMANMGPLSKLAAFAVHHAADSRAVLAAQEALLVFTSRLLDGWQRCQLSEVEGGSEAMQLSPETLQTTWPLLWQVLQKVMFATTAVLQAVVARSLLDPHMSSHGLGADTASKSLQMLGNLFFISHRNGNGAFQVYTFTYMTSLDVLSRDPVATEAFLREIQPAADAGALAPEPDPATPTLLRKTLDLYHLNVSEHLPLSLATEACEALVVKPALAYLSDDGPMAASASASAMTTELFESAHSALLSVLSCPQHSALSIKLTPFYMVKLLQSFPQRLSPRQFRIAFKTVMEMVSPPYPIAAMDPHLSETLLEMLRANMSTASTQLIVVPRTSAQPQHQHQQEEPLSEQSALVMALIDSLPLLPLPLVEEWLDTTARAMNEVEDPRLQAAVKRRFRDVLASGEMDVDRSTMGVAWWGTRGGRELVLAGEAVMSGALSGDVATSRL